MVDELIEAYTIITIKDPLDQDNRYIWSKLTKEVGDKVHITRGNITMTRFFKIIQVVDQVPSNCLLLKVDHIYYTPKIINSGKLRKQSRWGVMPFH